MLVCVAQPAAPLSESLMEPDWGQAPERPGQPARQDGGTDPIPRFTHGGVRETDDGEPGRPLETWISTETGCPTAPLRVAEATVARMREDGRIGGARGPALFRDRSPKD